MPFFSPNRSLRCRRPSRIEARPARHFRGAPRPRHEAPPHRGLTCQNRVKDVKGFWFTRGACQRHARARPPPPPPPPSRVRGAVSPPRLGRLVQRRGHHRTRSSPNGLLTGPSSVVHVERSVERDGVRGSFCKSGSASLVRSGTRSRVVARAPRDKQRRREWVNLIEFCRIFRRFRARAASSPYPVNVSPMTSMGAVCSGYRVCSMGDVFQPRGGPTMSPIASWHCRARAAAAAAPVQWKAGTSLSPPPRATLGAWRCIDQR